MLKTGLNPYGLTYHLGLQGKGTPRANPLGKGLEGFIAFATELKAKTLEIFDPWLAQLDDAQLATLSERLNTLGMTPVILVCQAFVPAMVAKGQGSVINIASAAAHMGCSPEVVYSTLKAAVVHYTRCLAKKLLEYGVRINAVSPGPAKTARFQATRVVDPVKMESSGKSFNRYAEPAEIADAVAFLAGPHKIHQ